MVDMFTCVIARAHTHTICVCVCVCVCVLFFNSGFLCVALAILELILYTKLALNSKIFLALPLEC